MRTIIWIYLLVAFTAESSLAKVTSVTITSVPPEFVVEGQKITFTCIGNCDNSTCEAELSHTTLTNVSRNTNNKVSCVVTDPGDSHKLTENKTFVVHYGPDSSDNAGIFFNTTTRIGETLEVIEDKPASLYCRRGACSDCTLSWWKEGVKVRDNVKTDTLQLFGSNTRIQRKDAGVYICKAENTFSKAKWEKEFRIVVQYHPKVSLQWNQTTKTLTCRADEGVPSTYTYKDKVHSVGSTVVRTISNNKPIWQFDNISYQDTGTYSCIANNGITSKGEYNIKAYTTITIEDKPVLVTATDSYTVSKGHTLTMEMDLYAKPEVLKISLLDSQGQTRDVDVEQVSKQVQTKFHGKVVTVQGIKLYVKIVAVLESYFNESLKLSIGNGKGDLHRTVKLFPQGAPDMPGNFSLTDKSHNMVKFRLITGFFNGAPQTLVLEYRRPGNTSDWKNGTSKEAGAHKNNLFELSINDLDSEATYEFRAYSYNEYAISSYTAVITQTLQPTPIPVGIIVGVTLSVLIVIIIIIVVIVCKRRRENSEDLQKDSRRKQFQKNSELVGTIPMSPVFANNEYSLDPVSRDSTDMDADSDLNHQVYVNTQIGPTNSIKTPPKSSTPRQESVIYQNTALQTFGSHKRSNSLTQDNEQTMAPYLELTGSGEKVEEAYLTMTDAKALAKTPKLDETPELDGYLDMNQSKALVEATRKTHASEKRNYTTMESINTNAMKQHKSVNDSNQYSNMVFNTDDYQNVTKKMAPPTKQKPRVAPDTRSDSVPEYQAPPPPRPLVEDESSYMNIRLKH